MCHAVDPFVQAALFANVLRVMIFYSGLNPLALVHHQYSTTADILLR